MRRTHDGDRVYRMAGRARKLQARSLQDLQAIRHDPKKEMSARIEVYVQPRASRTEVAGLHDGRLKIRLAAPPVDGAANAELVSFIAARLGIAKSKVRIAAGESSRRKIVVIEGIDQTVVEATLVLMEK